MGDLGQAVGNSAMMTESLEDTKLTCVWTAWVVEFFFLRH